MSRRRRHIHARPDEWIVVHRSQPPGGSPGTAGCDYLFLVLFLALLLGGC